MEKRIIIPLVFMFLLVPSLAQNDTDLDLNFNNTGLPELIDEGLESRNQIIDSIFDSIVDLALMINPDVNLPLLKLFIFSLLAVVVIFVIKVIWQSLETRLNIIIGILLAVTIISGIVAILLPDLIPK